MGFLYRQDKESIFSLEEKYIKIMGFLYRQDKESIFSLEERYKKNSWGEKSF